jgi:Cu2+-exporting ATPase
LQYGADPVNLARFDVPNLSARVPLQQVDVVVFDKTGTLTAGKPVVTGVVPLVPPTTLPSNHLLQLAAAVERSTTHPVAKALVNAADAAAGGSSIEGSHNAAPQPKEQPRQPMPLHPRQLEVDPESFVQEPGSGVTALVGGRRVSVGTLDWLSRQGASITSTQQHALEQAVVSHRDAAASGGDVGAAQAANGHDRAAAGVGNSHSRVYVALGAQVVGAIDVQVSPLNDYPQWLFIRGPLNQ